MKKPGSPAGAAFAVAVLAIVATLVVPLPPWLLDALLALDIMGAAAVLVIALTLREPLEFATFPTLLLVATLFRLSLDVSATRLILTQGADPGGVGTVIPAFGDFVMRGSIIVGMLMFVILIVVQLVVVTNGAQRVAEVAARFTLDAMPGKQMAIDADLHAGVIDAVEAKAKRAAVQAEADFYGAMDGAGKFVRGDAIAALVIVGINIVAGIGIGTLMKHMELAEATQTFTLLSVGNALATTLPAFLLSTAMGIIVTRASSDQSLGEDLLRQALAHPSSLRTVGIAMLVLALVPGLPHVAFGFLGVLGLAASRAAERVDQRRRALNEASERQRKRVESGKPEGAVALLGVEQLGIDLGEALLPLLEEPAGTALLQRIGVLRRSLALELGIVLPGVHIRDDLRLPQRGFAIRVRDRIVARGQLHPDRALALGSPSALSRFPGEAATDPVTGCDAKWLQAETSPGAHEEAVVVDPIAVLTSRLGVVAREHAAALLGRQEVQWLIDHVRRTNPAAIKGVVPELAGLGLVQRVLQHLARERVSIRDFVAILETIADEAEHTKDAALIGEAARRRLAPAICAILADAAGVIPVLAISARSESELNDAVVATDRGVIFGIEPTAALALAGAFRTGLQEAFVSTILSAPSLRLPLARFVELCGVNATVVSLAEIAPGYSVEVKATLDQPLSSQPSMPMT
jgi:flagellar biosynthesis protein FlhA